ncbi:MAG: lactate racemase domain-containing protein [Verrucomicrobia bacterium]|jgi:nickel-dependent lactate racemase|nr:lactate racemase domain-containing protein [Verrucomicrobiota bacterium]
MKSSRQPAPAAKLTDARVAEVVARSLPTQAYAGKRVLLVIPDATRTAPVGLLFKTIVAQIGAVTRNLDVMVALGTHPPMSEEAICSRLEIDVTERKSRYGSVKFFNHEWNNPAALQEVGVIPASDIDELTSGLFSMEVPVEINRLALTYDQLIIVGPVFPHEVVGFSGGNKYLFPGIGGPKILNFFHWLGAVCTNPMIIGNKWTPVRKVVDRAAKLVSVDKRCFAMVVAPDKSLAGLFFGTPESAWDDASELSRQIHITYKEKPFKTVLSCAPPMYDEIWVAGKCMYKLEPVVADGGELIIYAPHVQEVSVTHGRLIEEIGYHCRDYFLKQWDKFKHYPWGVLAHSTHVRGIGTFEHGVEQCRIQVTLATGIPEATCRKINLGYRNPASIRPEAFADREDEGVLLVPKAGEMLYQLTEPPPWAAR